MKQLSTFTLLLGLGAAISIGPDIVERLRPQPHAKLIAVNSDTPPFTEPQASPLNRNNHQKKAQGEGSEVLALALHNHMQNKVGFDAFGNYRVDTSLPGGSSTDYLISRWPIRYPNANELDQIPHQCGLGSYLIEFGADAVFVSVGKDQVQVFIYHCDYDARQDSYTLKLLPDDGSYSHAIETLLSDVSSARR